MPSLRPGPRNLITDVDGLLVGNIQSSTVRSGVTVVLPETRVTAACSVGGGAPGTRDTDALDPSALVDAVDAVMLSGGSTYGLDAASGAVSWLGARERGFRLGTSPLVSPIVPGAILFDLDNGGDKDWGERPPYRDWGLQACGAAERDFALGNVGAGMGAVVGNLKGGLGSASLLDGDVQIGALVAVNAFGSAVVPGTAHLWAAPFGLAGEFGAMERTLPAPDTADPLAGTRADGAPLAPGGNTTIGVVGTNLALTKAEARRIAVMAQDGLARALRPVHSQVDGDTLFVLSTGTVVVEGADRLMALLRLGALAADCVTRAVGRAVLAAEDLGDRRSIHALRAG
jgi:L-aminopeptidase/D-esterase-like protein